jgi:hypothetical protein
MGSLRLGEVTPETTLPETVPPGRDESPRDNASVAGEDLALLVCAPVMGRGDY